MSKTIEDYRNALLAPIDTFVAESNATLEKFNGIVFPILTEMSNNESIPNDQKIKLMDEMIAKIDEIKEFHA